MVKKLNQSASGRPSLRESSSSLPIQTTSSPLVPEVVEFDELTEEEERERLHWERKVERAFYEAGKALQELKDRRLYRSTHRTFEEYCRDRFGYNRSRSYQFIDAAGVVDNLQKCPQIVDIFPTREGQVRPLTQLEPDEQVEAWVKAVEENQGQVPSARIVKDVVQRICDRHPAPNPYRVGDVCTILVKENPAWRGYGGCWAIVTEVHQFSCTVKMWDGLHQVRLENLKELRYSEPQQEQVKQLGDRLSKIPLDNLEKPVRDFLAGLGKLKRPWLTALEEGMLQFVEEAIMISVRYI